MLLLSVLIQFNFNVLDDREVPSERIIINHSNTQHSVKQCFVFVPDVHVRYGSLRNPLVVEVCTCHNRSCSNSSNSNTGSSQ